MIFTLECISPGIFLHQEEELKLDFGRLNAETNVMALRIQKQDAELSGLRQRLQDAEAKVWPLVYFAFKHLLK
jgi:hypothetical protein